MCARSAGRLYVQTSDLLGFAGRVAAGAAGLGAARDAARVLCEKLSSVCLTREAALLPSRYLEYAGRIEALLRQSSAAAPAPAQPVAAAAPPVRAAAAAGGGGSCGKGGEQGHQPSIGSAASSQEQMARHVRWCCAGPSEQAAQRQQGGSTSQPPALQLSAELQCKLLACARQVARSTEQLRRATHSFQAFVERPDVQQSRPARLAAVHMAAMGMDLGLGGGPAVRAHALHALECIGELAAAG